MKRYFLIFALLLSFPLLAQEEWEIVIPESEASSRHENSFVECNGKFYLIGGRGERPVDEYDPKTNSWQAIAQAPLEISHFQAIAYENEIWIVGAFTGNYPHETPIEDILIFNPEKKEWRNGPKIPKERLRGSAGVAVYQDKIYLAGGIIDGHYEGFVPWLDELDPKTGKWRVLPDAPHARDHISAAIVNDQLYLAGGRTSHAAIGKVLETTVAAVDYYNFKTGIWKTEKEEIPTERAGNSNLGIGKYLIVLNGESEKQESAHAEVEVLNTETGTWKSLPSLGIGRHGTGAVFFDGKIWVAAGSKNRGGGPETAIMEVMEWKSPGN
ncbi:Kelch repeat-containing protein [Algoriphagus hitonicola]|uniref:N-acetylneuraminic acid mutarotase n=1 Tax=Algoriphagus hitonicola TaxID=435880 RepID=A0A1I2TQP8_9BACT|nr:kelch motif-containing protein [Algoriphagus hitonicola]SFG65707.1 N-acetylneuraminic acid mutarotase [Algoriphagus hitonicola]